VVMSFHLGIFLQYGSSASMGCRAGNSIYALLLSNSGLRPLAGRSVESSLRRWREAADLVVRYMIPKREGEQERDVVKLFSDYDL
jgi:hypothetical protein